VPLGVTRVERFPRTEDAMTCYRIYTLNQNGLTLTGSDETCESDEAAVAWAKTIVGNDAHAEIWEDARCVGQLTGATDLGAEAFQVETSSGARTGFGRAKWVGPVAFEPRDRGGSPNPLFLRRHVTAELKYACSISGPMPYHDKRN